MKTLLKDINKYNLIIVLFTLFSLNISAKPIMRVINVSGKAFISRDNRGQDTRYLRTGQHVESNSDIFTDVEGSVILTDFYDQTIKITGSSHINISERNIVLIRGYILVETSNNKNIFNIITANSKISYSKAKAIISFNQHDAKTQVVTLNGAVSMFDRFNKYSNYVVSKGRFSIMDSKNGLRTPAAVGFSSYKEALALFNDKQDAETTYDIQASIEDITQRDRAPASVMPYTNKKVHRMLSSYIQEPKKASKVKIIIYGQDKDKKVLTSKKSKNRMPSSISKPRGIKRDSVFEMGLEKTYKMKKKHSEELNQLIDELKSIGSDYSSEY